MKSFQTGRHRGKFKVLASSRSSQAAMMVLPPGENSGEPGNEHPKSDQWLFVIDGAGVAIINGRRIPLRRHVLLLINKGDRHQIKNTGRRTLATLNLYAPPAYDSSGELK